MGRLATNQNAMLEEKRNSIETPQ